EIWLTDLEGHADIYDNDSIKINYADSFDQSRITKIEVYRNGIKMDFLPDMIGSLTNDQMKTFDGNLLENTPASSHTDHAIWGYEYLLDFVSKEPAESPVHRKITVLSPALPKFNTPYAYIGTNWESRSADAGLTDDEIGALLRELKNSGFVGISVNVNCYIETVYSSDVFILTKPDGVTSLWSRTASDEEIARILSLAAEQDLETELRMQLYVSHEWTSVHGGYSGEVDPENPGRFFMSYGDLALHYAALAEAYGAVLFTPFTEMDAIEKYTDEVRQFYGGLDSVFSGAFSFEEGTHHFLLDSAGYNLECRFENSVGRFWDWTDTAGEPLTVEWSCWTPTLETQADQRLSVLVERMVEFWAPALGFYREHYPDNRIRFGEIGVYTMDGICLGNDYYSALQDASSSYQFGIIDEQEVADIWAAYLIASHYMELDGLTAWTFLPSRNWEEIYKIQPASSQHFGAVASGISPPLAVISSLLGGEWEGIYVSERVEESVVVLSVGTLDYPGAVEVVAYLDWETVPLSETTSWGLRGCDVKSVKASISSDELFIELELYENGLTSGNFGAYAVVLLLASGDRVAIGMIPGDRSVVLEYDNQISNQYVDTISGSAVAVSPQTMSVSIPINALSSVVSREALCGATFSLVLEAFPDSHHEIFWFPGKAAVDCQK
ncbi:hypothetical protein KAH43_05575, partial [Candidatus Bipolaricaulota bacterium]|nr:hypothetical protein [Candidatus Bipolaricaulota bacterium]